MDLKLGAVLLIIENTYTFTADRVQKNLPRTDQIKNIYKI